MHCPSHKMHKYKLVYFDTTGRAEPIRWMFYHAGQDFEDSRIQGADWPKLKATTPTGQLPYLEVSGHDKPLVQSLSIARYVARKTGLAGKDDYEMAQADAVVDSVTDATKGAAFVTLEPGIHTHLKNLENLLKANHGGDGYFAGNKPTWADFITVAFLDQLVPQDKGVLDQYPHLKGLVDRVHGLKGIKEWLVKRPPVQAP